MTKTKDFYYSKKSFHQITLLGAQLSLDEWVCEALIDGEWKVFTEQVESGVAPLSVRWGDLLHLGCGVQTRYTSGMQWVKENKKRIKIEDGKLQFV